MRGDDTRRNGGRACKTCLSPDLAAIDEALVGGTPAEVVARKYRLPVRSVQRHRAAHLPATLARAQAAAEVARADGLLDQVVELQRRTVAILDAAENADPPDLGLALRAIREARGNLELIAKLAGDLDERAQVAIILSPEWVEVRSLIVQALSPYPEARAAVSAALLERQA